jgi:methylated-DNA-[protein]-cysteine S-methyltransferase|tara:strand:+ start:233 stop:751 length:519 start_codon:yes stop_codon:yes gene_type:complete
MIDARCDLLLSVFPTPLGWFGLLGDGESVHGVEIGHNSAASLRKRVGTRSSRESDWDPELRSRMEDFAAGEEADFDDVALVLPAMTDFRFQVMNHVRGIGYGQTLSYGEVARRIGRPRAARAVGTVMANNPVPILVPCHRVVAASGRLGGFSAPQGTELKKRLLALEEAGAG